MATPGPEFTLGDAGEVIVDGAVIAATGVGESCVSLTAVDAAAPIPPRVLQAWLRCITLEARGGGARGGAPQLDVTLEGQGGTFCGVSSLALQIQEE
jgi:hypothetical protein